MTELFHWRMKMEFETYDDDKDIFSKPIQSKLEKSGFDDVIIILAIIAGFAMLVCVLQW